MILPSPQHGLRQLLNHHAQKHGVDLHVAVEVDSLATIVELVQVKAGLTILPLAAFDRDVLHRLRAVSLVEPRIMRTIVMATSTNKPVSRASRTLLEIIRREADTVKNTIAETSRMLAFQD